MAVDLVPAGNFTRNEGFRPLRFVGGRCGSLFCCTRSRFQKTKSFGRPDPSAGAHPLFLPRFSWIFQQKTGVFPRFAPYRPSASAAFRCKRVAVVVPGLEVPHVRIHSAISIVQVFLIRFCSLFVRPQDALLAPLLSTVGFRAFSRFRRAVSALQQARYNPVLTKPACLWPLSFTPEKERVRRQHAGLFRCGRFDRLFTRYFSPCLPSPPA